MSQEIDLDDVVLTPAAVAAWSEVVQRLARALQQLQQAGKDIPLEDIPLEKARVEDDGSLTVYVSIPNVLDADLTIPPDQWERKQ